MSYWKECIQQSFEDAGIVATREQIESVADSVQVSHENYGMSHGYDSIPNPLASQNRELRIRLAEERDKEICPACNGRGRITERCRSTGRSVDFHCSKCSGRGYIYPNRASVARRVDKAGVA